MGILHIDVDLHGGSHVSLGTVLPGRFHGCQRLSRGSALELGF
jgi:hypothetical protein